MINKLAGQKAYSKYLKDQDFKREVVRVFLPHEKGKYLLQEVDGTGMFPKGVTRMPGGGIEKGETHKDAFIREMKEEFNLDPKDLKDAKYLGNLFKEHLYYLKNHNLKPGTYQASNSPDEINKLVSAKAKGKKYWGAEPEKFMTRKEALQKVAKLITPDKFQTGQSADRIYNAINSTNTKGFALNPVSVFKKKNQINRVLSKVPGEHKKIGYLGTAALHM